MNKLNNNTQNKFDQLQVGDRLLIKNAQGQRIISDWKIYSKDDVSVQLISIQSKSHSMMYTAEEVQDLEFARVIE